MRAITVYLTIVLTLALAHCQWSQDRHLSRQVRPAELIGKWTMTQQSVGDLRAAGLKANVDPLQHTITINADGTCYFHTFPSAAAAGGHITPAVEGPCRWRLLQDAEDQSLLINIATAPASAAGYEFFENDGALVLWQVADDPDTWRYVEYAKD